MCATSNRCCLEARHIADCAREFLLYKNGSDFLRIFGYWGIAACSSSLVYDSIPPLGVWRLGFEYVSQYAAVIV